MVTPVDRRWTASKLVTCDKTLWKKAGVTFECCEKSMVPLKKNDESW